MSVRSSAGGPPVLVLRALGLGDALTGVPALRALRRLAAPRPVLLAAPHRLGQWMVDLGVVDGVVDTQGLDAPPPGRALGEHDAVDLHGNGPASRDLLAAARPRSLLAFAEPGSGVRWRADEHEVLRWCRLVGSVGALCGLDDLRLTGREGAARRTADAPVVLHPGAAFGSRRWPADRWARVAAGLARAGHRVVVTGSADERGLCARVASGLPPGAVTAGRLDLPALAALVGSARLVLCGDTGVAHLATALAVPSVVLFGPISPATWGPGIDLDLHTVLWHGDGKGDPHGTEPDPHLLLVSVEEVLTAARQALDAAEPGRRQR